MSQVSHGRVPQSHCPSHPRVPGLLGIFQTCPQQTAFIAGRGDIKEEIKLIDAGTVGTTVCLLASLSTCATYAKAVINTIARYGPPNQECDM